MPVAGSDLAADVLTLLCFLQGNDVKPRPLRFLPQKAIARISLLMCDPDAVPHTPVVSEFSTRRMRLVHYLAEATGLIAHSGSFLKPTPAALLWLTLPSIERTHQIFVHGLAPQSREEQRLWKTYRLPGWRLRQPTNAVRRVLSLLRAAQTDVPLTIEMLFPPISVPDMIEAIVLPPDVARELLNYLAWFGVIQWLDLSTVCVTDLGRALLSDGRPVPAQPDPALPPVVITDEGDIIAADSSDWPTLFALSELADLIAVHPQRRYRLQQERVQRAAQRGMTEAQIVQMLVSASGDLLPQSVRTQIQQWTSGTGFGWIAQVCV